MTTTAPGIVMTDSPQRPECFEFALDFLGDPEAAKLRAYVEQLEARAALAAEPVAEGPTRDELWELWLRLNNELPDRPAAVAEFWEHAQIDARAHYGHQPAPPDEGEAIGPEWQPCVKLPITVHVREQRSGETHVSTREGITPVRPDDLIMRGVQGEEYPIGRELFNKTYRIGTAGHQPAPAADGEVAELVVALRRESSAYSLLDSYRRWQLKLTRAADLLEQRHPTPVPVAERLPGPGDCDEEGLCWWFSPADPSAGTFGVAACWVLRKHEPEDDFRTHWLPANALPLPQGEVE